MLNAGDRMQGFRAQSMGGPKGVSVADALNGIVTFSQAPTTYAWTVPVSGAWKFAVWGPGGIGNATHGGAGGGYAEITKTLAKNDTVSVLVPAYVGDRGGATTLTFSDGKVVAANGASNSTFTGGTATGGDVNINGADGILAKGTGNPGNGTGGGPGGIGGAANFGGAGASANLPFLGASGDPGPGGLASSLGPGAGGCDAGSARQGPGMVIGYWLHG